MKYGESQFEAGSREIEEELGIETDPEKGEDVVRIEVEDDSLVSYYIIYFPEFEGEPEIEEESHLAEYKWVEAEEFTEMDWHSNAGYDIVSMKNLNSYLEKDNIY